MLPIDTFKRPLLTMLAEVFGVSPAPSGYVLDTGQSGWLGMIDQVDAAAASTALKPGGETIASHCNHVLFNVQIFAAFERGEQPEMDWPSSWANRVVDEPAWAQLRGQLRAAYTTLAGRLEARTEWPDDGVGAALILLAHCAYHLGESRQILGVLGAGPAASRSEA